MTQQILTKDYSPTETDRYFNFDFEVKSVSNEVVYKGLPGIFVEGYMAIWSPRDRSNDNWSLDLGRGSTSLKAIEKYFRQSGVLLYEHGKDPYVGRQALGQTVDYKVDDYGIWVKDFIPRPAEKAGVIVDVYNKIKAGILKPFSIGGRWAKDRKSTIVEIDDIAEHSVVSVPMMPDATFDLAESVKAAVINWESNNMARSANVEITGDEIVEIVDGIKAGASISNANKSKIRAAIAALEALIGESDEDDTTDMPGEMTKGKAPKKPGFVPGQPGVNPFAAGKMKDAVKKGFDPNDALMYLKGALHTMGDEKDPKVETTPALSGNVVTLPDGMDAGALVKMIDQFKAMELESEVTRIAEEKAAKLAEDQEKAEQAERERQAEIDRRVEAKLSTMRVGQRMTFAPDNKHLTDWSGKRVYQNKGGEEFSFLKFARMSKYNKEYDYMEKVIESYYGKAAVNETIGSQGGYLVPEEISTEIVDLLRPQAVIRALGVKTTTMKRDTLTKPRRLGGTVAYWGAEQASMTSSVTSYGQVKFIAKKLYVLVEVTKEMLADADPSVEADIREDMAAQMALAEDLAFINGSGIGEEPLGILKTPGVTNIAYATGAVSAAPEYTNMLKGAAIVRNNNANPNGVVMHSRVGDKLVGALDTTGQPAFKNIVGGYNWSGMDLTMGSRTSNNPNAVQIGQALGMKQAYSNQIPTSATTSGTSPVIIGDWRGAEIGDRQDIEIEVDRSLGFRTDTVFIKATKRVDFLSTLPASFVVITGFPCIDVA